MRYGEQLRRYFWLDTSFLYALFVEADKNHGPANSIWQACLKKKAGLVTCNFVTAELGALLAYRFGHVVALRQMNLVYDSSLINRLPVYCDTESSAVGWWAAFKDQKFSVVDCVSFELMNQLGITEALSFDCDFTIAGFTVIGHSCMV